MPKIKEINVMFLCNGSARLMTCLPIPISRKQFVEAFRVQGREVEIARLNRNWVRVRLPQIVPPPPEPNRNAIDERPINRLSARLLSGAFETTVLFNSYTYLLVFLPLVVSGYYILLPLHTRWRVIWLALASLYFYADWSARYLPLLLASTLFNFGLGKLLETKTPYRLFVLRAGVGANLALLIVFKYTNFLVAQLDLRLGLALPQTDITLPIGISFFTFTQIAYLIDLSRGICVRYDLWRYVLFVSFFPHLLAGPILHHKEMMPQFARRLRIATYERQIGYGLLIFSIGLFKKVCLADPVAPYANAAFNASDHGVALSLATAWCGALAYTFQLYFDFSGYSDMAIGSARLFGIRLPINFNAPYRAASIIEFWRRWHMTLSRFLRDYLYFSLGGNRLGAVRRYINLLLTMTLGGIWHGAGYGFALWGLLHGGYLVSNHAWRALRRRIPVSETACEGFAGGVFTFVAVVIGWVLFRATSLEGAGRMLSAMVGLSGVDSSDVGSAAAAGMNILMSAKISTLLLSALNLDTIAVPSQAVLGSIYGVFWLFPLLVLATLGPTSQQIVTSIVRWARSNRAAKRWLARLATVAISLLFLISLSQLNHVTEFLYFQF